MPVCTGLHNKRFHFFVDGVLYFALLLLLSGDTMLNPGLFGKDEMDYLKKLQDAMMTKLGNIDTRITNHDAKMAEINGMLDTTQGQIGNAMKLVQEHATVIKDLTHRVRVQQIKNIDIGNRSRILNLV